MTKKIFKDSVLKLKDDDDDDCASGWSSDDETEGVKRSKKIKVESDEEWVPSSGENSRSRRKTAPAKKRSGTASKKTESVHKDKRPVKVCFV